MSYAQCEICTDYKLQSTNLCFLTRTQKEGVEMIVHKLFSLSVKIHSTSNICMECDEFLINCHKFYEKVQNALKKFDLEHRQSQKNIIDEITQRIVDPLNVKIEFDKYSSDIRDLGTESVFVKCKYLPEQGSSHSLDDNQKHNNADPLNVKFEVPLLSDDNDIDKYSSDNGENYCTTEEDLHVKLKNSPEHTLPVETTKSSHVYPISTSLISNQCVVKNDYYEIKLEEREVFGKSDIVTRSENKVNLPNKKTRKKASKDKSAFGVSNSETKPVSYSFPKEIFKDGKLILKRKELNELIDKFYDLYCDLCTESSTFDSHTDLLQHYRSKHDNKGYLRCCDKKLYWRIDIKLHMTGHLQPSAFKCTICQRCFPRPGNLAGHMATHIPDLKVHMCDKCDKRFPTKSMLTYHMANHLPDDQKYLHKCDMCDKGFGTKIRLRHHQKYSHLNEIYICAVCGKTFKVKSSYVYHIGKHDKDAHKVKKIPCQECGTECMNESTLRRHMATHGPKRFPCDQCDYKAFTRNVLTNHKKRRHCNIRPFQCTCCSKSFKIRKALEDHMSLHTGEQKYSCLYCPRTFAHDGNKYKHMRIHPEYMKIKKSNATRSNNSFSAEIK